MQEDKTTNDVDDTRISDDAKLRALRREPVRERQMWLVFNYDDVVSTRHLSPGSMIVVGRDPMCDVCIKCPEISRRHVQIGRDQDLVWIEDLDSANGTLINSERLIGRRVISSGDEIWMGRANLLVCSPGMSGSGGRALESHDLFIRILEHEVRRAGELGGHVALCMLRPVELTEAFMSRAAAALTAELRGVDSMAPYAPDVIEVMLPDVSYDDALERARSLATALDKAGLEVTCAAAVVPDCALTVDELLEVARETFRSATRGSTVLTPARRASVLPPPFRDNADASAPVIRDPRMQEVFATARRVAAMPVPVLLLGATGVGKEVVARAIHEGGPRNAHELVSVNCGAIPDQLVESTFFGHERGSFTGADRQQLGVFELAHRGTLFLDEIGELAGSAQAALLRAIETRRIRRVGGKDELEVDVRIVAATHRDLERMCDAGAFRRDLLYRLNTIVLRLPPLRDRIGEIPTLAQRFLAESRRVNGASATRISQRAMSLLLAHSWPGNIRELRNIIEHASVNARGDIIEPEHLPGHIRAESPSSREDAARREASGELRAELHAFERGLILRALDAANWKTSEAARRLNVPLRTLSYRMRVLNIVREHKPET